MRLLIILAITLTPLIITNIVIADQGYCPSCGEIIDTSFDEDKINGDYKGSIQVYRSSSPIKPLDTLAYNDANEMQFQILVPITIGGIELMALVDTGATHSVIAYDTFTRMQGAKYIGTSTGATMTNEIDVVFYDVPMTQGGLDIIGSVGVVPKGQALLINADAILGFSTLRKLGLNVDIAGGKVYR